MDKLVIASNLVIEDLLQLIFLNIFVFLVLNLIALIYNNGSIAVPLTLCRVSNCTGCLDIAHNLALNVPGGWEGGGEH